MMTKRLLAVLLSCTVLLSLSAPAFGIRVSSTSSPKPTANHQWPVVAVKGALSFDHIGEKIQENNPIVRALEEGMAAAEALDRNAASAQLEQAIQDLETMMKDITDSSAQQMTKALTQLIQSLEGIKTADAMLQNITGMVNGMVGFSSASAALLYSQVQLTFLCATLQSMQTQLDGMEDTAYDRTLQDTRAQIDNTVAQLIAGAESLYATIQSTELQEEALNAALISTARMVKEMELRYTMGHISKQTLEQVQNGYQTLVNNVGTLKSAIFTLHLSLQALLGEPLTGNAALKPLPVLTADTLSGLSVEKDMAAAKQKSYSLYTAARAVEDAAAAQEDAKKKYGAASYQYQMAEHTYQAALAQQKAADASFELAFRRLYQALTPALNAQKEAENAVTQAEKSWQTAQLKYHQGKLSANGLAAAQEAVDTARRNLISAQINLFTAYNSYQNAVEYGLAESSSSEDSGLGSLFTNPQ